MKFPFINQWLGRGQGDNTLGLEIRSDGIAWALRSGQGQWRAGFDECTPARREAALKKRVQELEPGQCRVRAVLPIDQYQVFQIERPPVEEAELATAAQWKLKDLVDFGVEDAVVDVFGFPDNASRGRGELINAVIARKSLVRDVASLVSAAGLELTEMDVAELAMRNLINGFGAENRGAALVYLRRQYGHMVVCQGATLYMSRRVDVSAAQLGNAGEQEQAVMSLGLELQRSLDYYESQLGQVPPRQIHIIGHDESLPLGGLLANALAAEVVSLPLAEALNLPTLDSRTLYALGAARVAAEAAA